MKGFLIGHSEDEETNTRLREIFGLLIIGFSLWLMSKLSLTTWIRFGVWLLIGGVVYALYGYRHSQVGRENQRRLAAEESGTEPTA